MHRHSSDEEKAELGPLLAGDTRPMGDESPDPLLAGHETAEIRTTPILRFVVGLGVSVIVVFGLMAFFFNVMAGRAEKAEPRLSPLVTSGRERVPPEPRLQTSPLRDYQLFLAAQDSLLESYGWASRDSGRVRIPIERAMEIVAARRLGASRGVPVGAHSGGDVGGTGHGGAPAGRTDVDSAATPPGRLPRRDLRLRPPSHIVEPAPPGAGDKPNDPNDDGERR